MNTKKSNHFIKTERTRGGLNQNLQRKQLCIYLSIAFAGLTSLADLHAEETETAGSEVALLSIRQVENASTTDAVANVTVTARKREEFVQDVPLPETVLGGTELARDGAVTLSDFAQKAPNLQVSATNSRQSSVALRGLGKNSANETIQSSVGIVVDSITRSISSTTGSFIQV